MVYTTNGLFDEHCCAINYAVLEWLFGSRNIHFPHVKPCKNGKNQTRQTLVFGRD